jgi:benzoate transport
MQFIVDRTLLLRSTETLEGHARLQPSRPFMGWLFYSTARSVTMEDAGSTIVRDRLFQQKERATMEKQKRNGVFPWLDNLAFNRFHAVALVLGGLVLTSAGFNLQVLAYAMPLIAKEWGLSPVQTGALVSYGFVGLMVGAIGFGAVADRIGRKRSLMAAICLSSLLGGAASLAQSYLTLSLLRFLSGVGIGGSFPLVVALISEFSPSKTRGRIVTAAVSGFTFGWAVAASVSMLLIPLYGWRLVFQLGIVPLVLLFPIAIALPESVRFLVEKGRKEEALEVIGKIERSARLEPTLWTAADLVPARGAKGSFADLFEKGLAPMTLLVWSTYLLNNMALYGLAVWLPSLLVKEGFSLVRSYGFAMAQAGGSAAGGFLLGCLMDRFGRKPGLMLIYLAGGLSVILFGSVPGNLYLFLAGAATGVFVLGTPTALNVVCSEIYPTNVRTTGVASAQAAGRLGSILGPVAGGFLQSSGVGFHNFFLIFSVPCFLCVALVALYPVNVRGEALEAVDERFRSLLRH